MLNSNKSVKIKSSTESKNHTYVPDEVRARDLLDTKDRNRRLMTMNRLESRKIDDVFFVPFRLSVFSHVYGMNVSISFDLNLEMSLVT